MKKKNKAILTLISGIFIGAVIGGVIALTKRREKENRWKQMSNKHLNLMLLFNRWLHLKQQNKSIVEYLHDEGIETVAIYGMSYLGQRLYDELKNTDIDVCYAIDNNSGAVYTEIDIYSPKDQLKKVDAVIVTAVTFFDEIKDNLSNKIDAKILSLEDILDVL